MINQITTDKDLDKFLNDEQAGEFCIDVEAWLMYIPVGYEKHLDLQAAVQNQ